MNINTRDMPFINFNGQEMQWIKFNNVVVYEAWKNLIANGVPPLTLLNCKGVDLIDYKIYGNSVQSRLPEEYQEVEYINGIQAYNNPLTTGINLNCKWKDISKIQIKMQFLKLSSNSHGSMIIKSTTNGTNSYTPFICSKTSGIIFEGINGSITNDYTKEQLTKNGMKEIEILIDNNTNSSNMYFGSWQDSAYSMDWQLQYLKMYNTQNKLIRDLVPCYRKADNVVGVYDLVNDVFYTNAGTGTFVKGNNVTPTPEAPIEIQSVGDKTLNLYNGKDWYIPVEANKYYQIKFVETEGQYKYITLYDENKQVIKNIISYAYLNPIYSTWIVKPSQNGFLRAYYALSGRMMITEGLTITLTSTEDTNITNNQYIRVNNDRFYTPYEPYGYKIPVKASNGTEEITTNIYLDEPLRKIGDYADYIDFENQKLLRNIEEIDSTGTLPLDESLQVLATPTEETIELPNVPTIKGTTILSVDTNIQPSNVEVVYKGK